MATPTPGAEKVFPPFDSTTFSPQLVWFALTFIAIYWMATKIILPRMARILSDRRARIDKDLDDAARAKTKAEEALAAYEKALADARGRGQAIAQQTRDTVAAESDGKRKALEADLGKRLTAAEKQIAEMKAKALANVDAIASEAAGSIIARLTGKAPAPDALAKAVAEAVKG
jgi:F-type H+-transporting ATPase subunit b